MSRFDRTPLFRTSVGFDPMFRLMDAALERSQDAQRYPPYNIVKKGDNDYGVTLAVAGFSEDDIEITAENRVLTVRSVKNTEEEGEDVQYLHRGIAARGFERTFTLAEHVKVVGATLNNGLLNIELQREVPEAFKPRRITITKQLDQLAAK